MPASGKYSINDATLIQEMETAYEHVVSIAQDIDERLVCDNKLAFPFPLDEETVGMLDAMLESDKDEIPYAKAKELDELWLSLIDKSIRCLRYFDKREPFYGKPDLPIVAYGMGSLRNYRDRYTGFESLLYGTNTHYRDHVFHSVRVWLIGVFALLGSRKESDDDGNGQNAPLINYLALDGGAERVGETNYFEKMSMWTIASLCHDLGYPLEKSEQILDKTKEMMREFVPKPSVSSNFAFTGTQDVINDYILKFMSTKLRRTSDDSVSEEPLYFGRIQPKYYLKYAKSLEKSKHGIISSVIVYKMLLFFLEADFNLNDDYRYSEEDARQFYIRREILRAMASHTCSDAYNVKLSTLPSLLFICDELQEWGRKSWGDLYSGIQPPQVKLSIDRFDADGIAIAESVDMGSDSNDMAVCDMVERLFSRQYTLYKTTFRDGQDSAKRDFDIEKTITVELPKANSRVRELLIEYRIPAAGRGSFTVLSGTLEKKEWGNIEERIKKDLKGSLYFEDLVCEFGSHSGSENH